MPKQLRNHKEIKKLFEDFTLPDTSNPPFLQEDEEEDESNADEPKSQIQGQSNLQLNPKDSGVNNTDRNTTSSPIPRDHSNNIYDSTLVISTDNLQKTLKPDILQRP